MAFPLNLKSNLLPLIYKSLCGLTLACLRFHVLTLYCNMAATLDFFLFPEDSKLWKVFLLMSAGMAPSFRS